MSGRWLAMRMAPYLGYVGTRRASRLQRKVNHVFPAIPDTIGCGYARQRQPDR